eukprot:jgi/Mesvir1/14467/Mv05176-RA.1
MTTEESTQPDQAAGNGEGPRTQGPEYDKFFTADQLNTFYSRTEKPELGLRFLSQVLDLQEYQTDAHSAIILDYSVGMLLFCQQHSMDFEQTAVIFSLGRRVLSCISGGGNFAATEQLFRRQLLPLCSAHPKPGTPHIFSSLEVKLIVDWFAEGLFRHFKLYAYAMTREQDHQAAKVDVIVETAVVPLLAASRNEEELAAHKASIVQQAEEERARVEAQQAAEAAEKARVAAEEAAQAELERLRRKPATLEEAVDKAIEKRVAVLAKDMEENYAARERQLLQKIEMLQAQLGSK